MSFRNVIWMPPAYSSIEGSGKPASLHASIIFEIPRPHASMCPALKNTSAMFLFLGLEGCFFLSISMLKSSGKLPGFHRTSVSL